MHRFNRMEITREDLLAKKLELETSIAKEKEVLEKVQKSVSINVPMFNVALQFIEAELLKFPEKVSKKKKFFKK